MNSLSVSITVCMMLLLSSTSLAADDGVRFAKSLSAYDYDRKLPAVPVEQWLSSVLPPGVVARWEDRVTDCGESSGIPVPGKQRDMPMCAEILFQENGRPAGHILLLIGTEKKGPSIRTAFFYDGEISQNGVKTRLKRLSDLQK